MLAWPVRQMRKLAGRFSKPGAFVSEFAAFIFVKVFNMHQYVLCAEIKIYKTPSQLICMASMLNKELAF